MARIRSIDTMTVTGRKPLPGGIVSIEAAYSLNAQFVDLVGTTKIRSTLAKAKIQVRTIISRSVGRAWRRSGLTRRTGRLLANSLRNFTIQVDFTVLTNLIEVRAVWQAATIDYFLAQLFGRTDIKLKPHNFIIFDRTALSEIAKLFRGLFAVLQLEAQKKQEREATAEIRPTPFRASAFRARRLLRQAGISPAVASTFVSSQISAGVSPAKLVQEIRKTSVVRKIGRGLKITIE